ncbi:MAG: hypothetical protein OIF34_10770, partial [Porticoccaceae bacterium]|nr:hypothetical protein [Porticoccaceae bacterium]
LTPALDSLFNWIGDITSGLVGWAEAYPQVTKVIGYAGLAILSLTGVLGVLTMAAGFGKIIMLGWGGAVSLWTTVTKGAAFATGLWTKAQTLLNMAWKESPFGMVLTGITMLIAAIPLITGLWDKFKNAFGDTWWGKALIAVLDPVMNWLKSLGKAVGWVLEKLGLSFEFSGTTKVEQQAAKAAGPTSPAMDTVFSAGTNPAAPAVPQVQSLQQMKQTSVPAGGIKQELTNISNKNSSNSSNSGPVTNNYYGPHSNTNEQFALEMS